jgi:flagellar biosynthesis protein FlhF
MKIKRFFAPDIRQALRQVKATLGADAVILSNKKVEGGIELVAAMDYDESAITASEPAKPAAEKRYVHQRKPIELKTTRKPIPERELPKAPTVSAKKVEWSQEPALVEMRKEMQELRRLMENELSELTWRDMGKRRPITQDNFRRLMSVGFDAALCRKLAHYAEDACTIEQAWKHAISHLAQELPVLKDDLIESGGVLALVGPTGVGKTTTIAKLAARFCLRHGNRQLALITTDNFRVGAQEQLNNYGRILDVPIRSVSNADELNVALNNFSRKRLVLIDTAGMSQRDLQINERLALFSQGNHPIRTILTLSATTQRAALSNAVDAFGVANPEACIITKMDEAGSLGGVISTVIERNIPLAYTTDGQRVPEDIHRGRALKMISAAVDLAQESVSDDVLALALGGGGESAYV